MYPHRLQTPNYTTSTLTITYPNGVDISPELDRLIRGLLVKDVNDRMTLAQLKEEAWFKFKLPEGAFAHNVKGRQIPQEVQRQESVAYAFIDASSSHVWQHMLARVVAFRCVWGERV